jgi:uncharacterized membrane protein YobD (UPF0266 family)
VFAILVLLLRIDTRIFILLIVILFIVCVAIITTASNASTATVAAAVLMEMVVYGTLIRTLDYIAMHMKGHMEAFIRIGDLISAAAFAEAAAAVNV